MLDFLTIKFFIASVGGFLVLLASQLEPSAAIWVVSIGGSLLTAAIGKDRPIKIVLLHIIIGLFWGIFGSQVIHAELQWLPQIAIAFFMSMFGVELTWHLLRTIKYGNITEFLTAILQSIIPNWLKGPKK